MYKTYMPWKYYTDTTIAKTVREQTLNDLFGSESSQVQDQSDIVNIFFFIKGVRIRRAYSFPSKLPAYVRVSVRVQRGIHKKRTRGAKRQITADHGYSQCIEAYPDTAQDNRILRVLGILAPGRLEIIPVHPLGLLRWLWPSSSYFVSVCMAPVLRHLKVGQVLILICACVWLEDVTEVCDPRRKNEYACHCLTTAMTVAAVAIPGTT